MSPSIRSFLLAGLCAALPAAGLQSDSQPDLSGRWLFTVHTPAGATLPTVQFVQDGSRLSGSYIATRGDTLSLEGSVRGDSLYFRHNDSRLLNPDISYRARLVSQDTVRGYVRLANRDVAFFGVRSR